MLQHLKWRSPDDRRRDARLVMMYKISHDKVAVSKSDRLSGPPRTMHSQSYQIPLCRVRWISQFWISCLGRLVVLLQWIWHSNLLTMSIHGEGYFYFYQLLTNFNCLKIMSRELRCDKGKKNNNKKISLKMCPCLCRYTEYWTAEA
jgi:hypothetical protein